MDLSEVLPDHNDKHDVKVPSYQPPMADAGVACVICQRREIHGCKVIPPCMHEFCEGCIAQLRIKNGNETTCPLCRRKVPPVFLEDEHDKLHENTGNYYERYVKIIEFLFNNCCFYPRICSEDSPAIRTACLCCCCVNQNRRNPHAIFGSRRRRDCAELCAASACLSVTTSLISVLLACNFPLPPAEYSGQYWPHIV